MVRQMSAAAGLRQSANEAVIGTMLHLNNSGSVIRPSLQGNKSSQRLHSGVSRPPTPPHAPPADPLPCLDEALMPDAQFQC